ncbi:MAG: hypothetical protein U1F23_07820 [Lysobacterales bacterium]
MTSRIRNGQQTEMTGLGLMLTVLMKSHHEFGFVHPNCAVARTQGWRFARTAPVTRSSQAFTKALLRILLRRMQIKASSGWS